MLVMFHCFDKDNQQAMRINTLQSHLLWVEQNMRSIKVAGPLLTEDSNTIIGSLYILEADNIEKANNILKEDPYYKTGIWQQITKTEFKSYAGTWVGGKNWPGASNSET